MHGIEVGRTVRDVMEMGTRGFDTVLRAYETGEGQQQRTERSTVVAAMMMMEELQVVEIQIFEEHSCSQSQMEQ